MIEEGAAYIGVATDHVIESFRNRLWSGYKTGDGVDRALLAQFHPLEGASASVGEAVWAGTRLEADEAPASAAHIAEGESERHINYTSRPGRKLAQNWGGEQPVRYYRD